MPVMKFASDRGKRVSKVERGKVIMTYNTLQQT